MNMIELRLAAAAAHTLRRAVGSFLGSQGMAAAVAVVV
jgi:hypothetical protein